MGHAYLAIIVFGSFSITVAQDTVVNNQDGNNDNNIPSSLGLSEISNPNVLPVGTGDATSCSETDAQWLAWSEWSACSDQCGSCGIHMRTRTCLTINASCACVGESTLIEHCNLEICRYPRTTCCNNLRVTSLKGRFACLANSTLTTG